MTEQSLTDLNFLQIYKMTKTKINEIINGFLTILVSIVKVKGSLSAIIDSVNPVPTLERFTVPVILTKENGNMIYNFYFTRVGKQNFITGWFENTLGASVNNQNLAVVNETISGDINPFLPTLDNDSVELVQRFITPCYNEQTGTSCNLMLFRDTLGVTRLRVYGLWPAISGSNKRFYIRQPLSYTAID